MALQQLDYQVDLLTLPIGQTDPAIHSRVIRVWNLFGSKTISIGPSILKLWFDLLLLIRGIGLVLRHRYSIVHGTEEAGFLCYLLSFLCRAKCVYEKHSDSASYKGGILKKTILGAYNFAEHLTIKKSDLVICTGPGLEEQAREFGPNSNIFNIPDIPSSIIEPTPTEIGKTRKEIQNNDNQIIVTYVGSFAEYQGIDIIFDAIPIVVKTNNEVKFVIIGGNDQEIADYRSKLDAQGITEQIAFLGKIDPDILPAFLASSDILLAPRKSGINSPLKILDYFKAGGAIVATNTVANQRLLNQDNAVLCEFNANEFANAINDLSSDPSKRKRIAENGHQLYLAQYNFSTFKEQLNQAYQTITQTPISPTNSAIKNA